MLAEMISLNKAVTGNDSQYKHYMTAFHTQTCTTQQTDTTANLAVMISAADACDSAALAAESTTTTTPMTHQLTLRLTQLPLLTNVLSQLTNDQIHSFLLKNTLLSQTLLCTEPTCEPRKIKTN